MHLVIYLSLHLSALIEDRLNLANTSLEIEEKKMTALKSLVRLPFRCGILLTSCHAQTTDTNEVWRSGDNDDKM